MPSIAPVEQREARQSSERLGSVFLHTSTRAQGTPAHADQARQPRVGLWLLALACVLVCGAGLRLVWLGDIEYKLDEAWTYEQASPDSHHDDSPWLGMMMSTGHRNPGMSIWVFTGLHRLFNVDEPTGLARAVQVLNVIALMLLVAFAFVVVPMGEREPWLWAAALGAANPLAVLFQRKIWPPSVLPIFMLGLLACWWRRQTRLGAFGWGLIAALIGQIHGAGFFFAAAFFMWALLFDRRNVRWKAWLAGSFVGALPMLPWIHHVLTTPKAPTSTDITWLHIVELKFWLRWCTESFGMGLSYALRDHFGEFLGYPLVFGRPTYLVAGLHAAALLLGGAILMRAGRSLWRQRSDWRELMIGRRSTSAFTQNAAFWGVGLMLTLSMLSLHRHYMIVLFPLEFLWVARLALNADDPAGFSGLRTSRRLLSGLVVTQLLITASFLGYIHANQGAPRGDYGSTYQSQLPTPFSAREYLKLTETDGPR